MSHRFFKKACEALRGLGACGLTEQVRKFQILSDELTVENGELTPTLKVRRPAVLERYREQVEEMYETSAGRTG